MKVNDQTLFKVLREDGSPVYGTGSWSLPNGKPGAWMPKIARLVPCGSGYHLARGPQVLLWLNARLFVAEHRGKLVEADNKVVVSEARLVRELPWTPEIRSAWCADVAESVLHLFEAKYPDDDRPRKAIEAARRYPKGHQQRANAANAAGYAADAAKRAFFDRLCDYLNGVVVP